jgi:hypothetical protein
MGSDGGDLLSSPVAVKAKNEIILALPVIKALKRGLLVLFGVGKASNDRDFYWELLRFAVKTHLTLSSAFARFHPILLQ